MINVSEAIELANDGVVGEFEQLLASISEAIAVSASAKSPICTVFIYADFASRVSEVLKEEGFHVSMNIVDPSPLLGEMTKHATCVRISGWGVENG